MRANTTSLKKSSIRHIFGNLRSRGAEVFASGLDCEAKGRALIHNSISAESIKRFGAGLCERPAKTASRRR